MNAPAGTVRRVGGGNPALAGHNMTRPLHVWDGGALPWVSERPFRRLPGVPGHSSARGLAVCVPPVARLPASRSASPRAARPAGCPASAAPLGPAARFRFSRLPGLSSIARLATRPRSPLEIASRPALSAFRGFPRVAPVSGGESFSTPLRQGRTRGFPQHFQDFLSIHKSSTINPVLSPAISRCPPHSPQRGPQAGPPAGHARQVQRVAGYRPANRTSGSPASAT